MKKVVLKRSEGGGAGAENNNTIRVVNYRECRRNLAVHTGGHAVDGCREFIPSIGAEETAALTCASCGCHRSFHRREEHVLPA